MNKLFVILALLAFMPADAHAKSYIDDNGAFVLAKAVKLGRGRAYSVAADSNVNTGTGQTELRKGECESNDECPSDKKCNTYTNQCVSVCVPVAPPGMSKARPCGGQTCIADPDQPHSFKCVDNCYNVVCKSGYTTEVTSDGCCCVADTPTCSAGTFPNNGTCTGCAAGTYSPDGQSCIVCPDGTYSGNGAASCTSCAAGTYASGTSNSDHYTCKSCSTLYVGSNKTCTSCTTTGICTGSNNTTASCDAGYYLSGSNCVACSSGTYSKGGTATSCSSCSSIYAGGSNIKCTSCTTTGTCTGSLDCSGCPTGYTKNLTIDQCASRAISSNTGCQADFGFTCGRCLIQEWDSQGSHIITNDIDLLCPQGHIMCPQGTACTNGGHSCKTCAAGSNLTYGNCNCPAGKLSDGLGFCR